MKSKKRIASLAVILGLSGAAFAQTPQASESDTIWTVQLKDVVISSLKLEKRIVETPVSLSVVGRQEYIRHSSFTVADVLKFEPGISMGGDGVWATNINVRGMSENRLVTLVDGNRVETATDLTASMSMIDVNDIERVEIIKGAQSSLYGSGAMGGIVNIISKTGHFAEKPYFQGNLISGYSSVNSLFNEYLSLGAGSENWYARINGSYNKANDVKTPEGTLPNSAFNMNNLGAQFGFKPFKNQTFRFQFQRNWSKDVGIPGGAAFAPTAEAKYSDISRTLFNASYEITDLTECFKSLKLSAFSQNIIRKVEMKPHSATTATQPNGMVQITDPQLVTPNGTHKVFGGQLQGTWNFSDYNTLIVGLDAWRRNMTTDRKKDILMTVVKPNGDTVVNHVERYETPLPKASFTNAGLFIEDEMRLLDERLTLTAGGRFDGIFVKNEKCYDVDSIIKNGEIQPMPSQRVTFESGEKNDFSWSANLGLLYNLNEKLDLVLNLARSYRAASLEERFKYIDLGSKVQLGNPSLNPEKGYSADLGMRYWGDKLEMQASVFMNRMTDMIVETDGIFIYHLTEESSFDTLPALIYRNVNKALLYGCDFGLDYHIVNGLQVYLNGAYIIGRDTENDIYLPSIPPMNGRFGIAYTYPEVGAINLSLMGAGAKNRDKIAAGEKPTDFFFRLDLSLNSKVFRFGRCGLQFFGGIDNITDEAYTNFLSTNRGNINVEPGRNFYIKANLTF